MECRTHEKRLEIVKNYSVTPFIRLALLNGQTKKSDAGPSLKDEYYVFLIKDKRNGSEDKIVCGDTVAEAFLKLIHHKPLELFNPLKTCISHDAASKNKSFNSNQKHIKIDKTNWSALRLQIYNAVMLLISIKSIYKGPIIEIKEEIEKGKLKEHEYICKIKGINTILSKFSKEQQTLSEMINVFKEENKFKDKICEFDLIHTEIEKYNKRHNSDGKSIKDLF